MHQGRDIGHARSFSEFEHGSAGAPAAAAAASSGPSPATSRIARARQLVYTRQRTEQDDEMLDVLDDVYEGMSDTRNAEYGSLLHSMAQDSIGTQSTQEYCHEAERIIKRRNKKKQRSRSIS